MRSTGRRIPDGGRHLNCYGAKKVTREIGKYISENYTFTNKKKDPEYKSWNKSYKEYNSEGVTLDTPLSELFPKYW